MKKLLVLSLSLMGGVLFAFDPSLAVHQAEATGKKVSGKELYLQHCARCHHADRIGISGPPLLPRLLRKYPLKDLVPMIRNGFEQTLMPKFEHLSTAELLAIARYIKSPARLEDYRWGIEEIERHRTTLVGKDRPLPIRNMANVTPVVERDGGQVWIMEDEKILDKFPVKNVHGGIKYQFPEARNIFVPTRDGWVEKYSFDKGRPTVRARQCIYLRNVSLSRDGRYGYTTCLLPEQLVIFDTKDMKTVEVKKLDGKVSALYEFYTKDKMIFTYRDKPMVGMVDTRTQRIQYRKIAEPIEDFFIDPFDRYLIATARRGRVLRVYEIDTLRKVFEHEMTGMPHLFSATYFYKDGDFYFATPHLRSSFITIWKMYDWDFVRKIEIGGDGFFAKTHPATPWLWVDNGSDELVLVSKKDYSIKKLIPRKGKQYIHAEFSGDGKYTYLSIYEHDGDILVWDTRSFRELADYPADIPVGKYNFICKNRRFYPMLFGQEVAAERLSDYNDTASMLDAVLQGRVRLSEFELRSVMDYLKYRSAEESASKAPYGKK